MGLLGLLGLLVGAVVVMGGATAGIAYASDYGLEAVVVERSCTPPVGDGLFSSRDPESSAVTVETKRLGIAHTQGGLAYEACMAVKDGNYIVYHIRSGRFSVYQEEGGACVYDSVQGLGGCP